MILQTNLNQLHQLKYRTLFILLYGGRDIAKTVTLTGASECGKRVWQASGKRVASDDTPFLIKPSISQKLSPGLSFHLQTHIASGVHGALIMDLALEYNHVALLQHRAKNSGNTVLFKWPILRGSEPSQEWKNVTVAEFAAEVDRVAGFLLTELTARGIPNRSVVTLL